MAVRLVKVAKELNVGTSTIVTFLNENGFEVDNKPTAKISDEMYAVLVENFKNSIAIKEKANKITIGSSPAKPNDEEVSPIKETPVEEAPKVETKKKESPKVEPTQKAELSGPKVLGKIDLEGLGKKKKKEAEPKPTTDDKPEDTSNEEPAEPVESGENEPDIQVDAPQLKGLKILGKINIETKKKKKKETSAETESEDGEPKRKRRRRKIVSNQVNLSGADSGEESSEYRQKSSSGKQFKSPDKEPAGGRNKKKGRKKSIDEKEIGQKLKETMSLLDGGGKKKKKFGTSRKERDEKREELLKEQENAEEEVAKIEVTEFISVAELAGMMNISSTDIIMACMREKRMVSINQRLDRDLIELMCIEFGYEVEFVSAEDQMEKDYQIEEDDLEDTENRSPIVTVMGHVDHGKTSLLDSIRKSNVADSEAGGITQHIGAYMVKVENGGSITFLDTPGHEAFTAMRARGAKVTDIAIIIISADDCIMPQTKEAISHAKAADVPIVFAINKIDKDGANPDKIKQELASMDLLIEEWGGTYQSQDVSAKQGLNIDALLEKVLLEAELLELKANAEKRAVGTVLEASLEQGRGYVAKVLVRNGTLKVGDSMIAGPFHGKVKAMFDERNKRLKTAGPSTPVLVLGLQGAPQAGETLNVMSTEKETKELASKRANLLRQQQIRSTRRVTLDDITNRIKIGNFKELNLIIKGDFDGSVEALSDSLLKLSTDQVQTNVIYKAVGPVTESDVNLAAASDAIIVGFQVRPNPMARRLAEKEGVEIKSYSIIYDAIDEIKSALEGMLEPKQVEEVTGMVEIQEVFKISKVGAVAGCFVQEGKVTRNSYIRIIREGIVEYPKKEGVHGELSSLKRFKDAVQEVKQGFECGLTIKNYNDIKQGDIIEVYTIKEVKQSL